MKELWLKLGYEPVSRQFLGLIEKRGNQMLDAISTPMLIGILIGLILVAI